MTIPIAAPVLLDYLLLVFRAAGLAFFLPIPGLVNAPEFIRIVLAISIAIGFLSKVGARVWSSALLADFLWLAAIELIWGLALGLCVKLLEEFALLGAQQLGFQAGYSYASTIDPSSSADSTVLQTLLSLFTVFLFFSLGIHRILIAGVMTGSNPLLDWNSGRGPVLEGISAVLTACFRNGLAFAIPVVAALIAVDILGGLAARVLPQLQTALLTTPIKMLLCFIGLAIVLPIASTRYRSSVETSVGIVNNLMRPTGVR